MPFLVAFAFAVGLTPALRRTGLTWGLVDRPRPDGLKIHPKPVALSGGLAVTGAVAAVVLLVRVGMPVASFAGVLVALLTGLVDDVTPLPAWVRVACLAAAGVAVAAGGARLGPSGAIGAAMVVVLVPVCANAMNILDGQDALAGGLGGWAALGLAGLGFGLGHGAAGGLGLAVAGALAGFLLWNRPPARIFLGNSGAYAVGTLLAVSAAAALAGQGWRGVALAGVCLAVPAFEMIFTVTRRFASGQTLARGDRAHSYDLLSARLGSRNGATLVFLLLGGAAAGSGVLLRRSPTWLSGAFEAAIVVAAAAAGLHRARRSDRSLVAH